MRAAICLSAADGRNSYVQYIELWAVAARAGWSIAGVFSDDCGSSDSPCPDELRRLIARRAVDVVLVWAADHLSREMHNELLVAQCILYSHQPAVQPPPAESDRSNLIKAGIARARAEGKRLGRPRINGETEQAIRAALATGKGIRKVACEIGVGVSVVQRVRAAG